MNHNHFIICMMKNFLVLIALLSITNLLSQSETYKQNLKKLFKYTSLDKSFEMSVTDMLVIYKKEKKEVPAKVWKEIEEELKTGLLEYFVELFMPIYFKNLDENDLMNVVTFYESASGKNYAKSSPLIMKEATLLAQEWTYKTHKSIAQMLNQKGFKTIF